jgi:hypothetical protein
VFKTECSGTVEITPPAALLTPSMFLRFLTTSALAAWAVVPVLPTVFSGPTSPYDVFPRTPAAGIDVKALAPSLSPAAKIYLPGSTQFSTYTTRWSNLEPPTPNVVIVAGTEKDVVEIVSFPAITCTCSGKDKLTLFVQGQIRIPE